MSTNAVFAISSKPGEVRTIEKIVLEYERFYHESEL